MIKTLAHQIIEEGIIKEPPFADKDGNKIPYIEGEIIGYTGGVKIAEKAIANGAKVGDPIKYSIEYNILG